MYINLTTINLCPTSGGGSSKPEETFSVEPTTTAQTVTPQEGYVFSGGTVSAVTSSIDQNIQASNIKSGVTILGVTGTVSPQKPEETFSVAPGIRERIITPLEGYVFSSGVVTAVDSTIDANIEPGNIKDGVEILGVLGTYTGGSGKDYRNQTGTVTGLADLGWDADSIGYYQANALHYSWQNSEYVVKQANKDLYGVVNKDNKGNYQNNTDMEYVPMFDTTGVTSMQSYFRGFGHIKGIPLLDTSSVTDIGYMFQNCSSLITIPLLDTSSVTSMNYMFNNCSSLITIPLLDTSSVTRMRSMFYECSSLTSIPLLDTGSVTEMTEMFRLCTSLVSIPLLDTSSVTSMSNMFNGCGRLTTVPALDTSSVTNMNSMFYGCSKLTTVPALDTSSVTNMNSMFYGCSKLTTISLLNTGSVTNMSNMFTDCISLTTIPALDTSSVTNMSGMFSNSKLTTVPVLDTSSATDMSGMFRWCSSLTTVEGIDFSSLTAAPNGLLSGSGQNVTRFIVTGKIDFTWNGTDGLDRLTQIDTISVESILEAMSRTTNTNAKTMKFNVTVEDDHDMLARLVADCQDKGWTITGLNITSPVPSETALPDYNGSYCRTGNQVYVNNIPMYEMLERRRNTLVGYGYLNMDDGLTYYYDTNGNKIDMDYYMDDFDRYLEENGLAH